MLEDILVTCPKCYTQINAKVMNSGRRPVYIVTEDCPNCKTKSGSIERGLNSMGKRWGIKTEKSYVKLGFKDKK